MSDAVSVPVLTLTAPSGAQAGTAYIIAGTYEKVIGNLTLTAVVDGAAPRALPLAGVTTSDGEGQINLTTPGMMAGSHTLYVIDAGGVQSNTISYMVSAPVAIGAVLTGFPTTGTAGTALALSGATVTLSPAGVTGYAVLATGGADEGARVALTGTTPPVLTPAAAGTYAYLVYAALTGGTALATSPAILVAAASTGPIAPDGTLTELPSTIVAGQPLSAAAYTVASGTFVYFVLYRVAAAAEDGLRWPDATMPGKLTLLIPQFAGAYTVRGYSAASAGNLTYESARFTVTAAPDALPGSPTQASDSSGATSSSVTMNWTAVSGATGYHMLARISFSYPYGSYADTTVTTNSFAFTGLPANSPPRAVVIAQNANGYGTPSGQFLSFPAS